MISLKDLIGELGGGRSVAMGGVLICCSFVAADRYVDSVETRLAGTDARFEKQDARIRELEAAKQRLDGFESAGGRFTSNDGQGLEHRIKALESWVEGGKHERRDPYRSGRP